MLFTPYTLAFIVLVAGASATLDIEIPSRDVPTKNLFKEYMTRGLYSCAGNYVQTLTKLHILIKEAAEEHRKCSQSLNAPKTYPSTEFEHINNLLEQYQRDDQKAAQAALSR